MEDFREVKWAFQNLRQAVTAEDMVVVTVEDTAGDNELRFIRTYFEMTIRSFAERFSVKHPAVVKWEKKADLSTAMAWTTEKDIRLFIIDQLIKRPSELQKLYRVLEEEAKTSDRVIKIDSKELKAA